MRMHPHDEWFLSHTEKWPVMKPKKLIHFRNLLVVVSALGDHLAHKSNGNRLDTGLPVA